MGLSGDRSNNHNQYEEGVKFRTKLVGYCSTDEGSNDSDEGEEDITDRDSNNKRKNNDHKLLKEEEEGREFKRKEFELPLFRTTTTTTGSRAENGIREGTRFQSNRKGRGKEVEEGERLEVFGYGVKLFRSEKEEKEGYQSNLTTTTTGNDSSVGPRKWVTQSLLHHQVTLDRFDVRELLDDLRILEPRGDNKTTPSSSLDDVRYEELDSEEETLFDMDEEERSEYLENKRTDREYRKDNQFHFDYTKGTGTTSSSGEKLPFPIPDGMVVPQDRKQLAILEKTAKFITSTPNPLLELKIQARQGTNPLFGFLNREDPLHPFFEKVKTLIKLGLYSYCTTEEDTQTTEPDLKPEPSTLPPPPSTTSTHTETETEAETNDKETSDPVPNIPEEAEKRNLITILAKSVALRGVTFEQKFRVEYHRDPDYAFLLPWDPFYPYYSWLLTKYRSDPQLGVPVNKVEDFFIPSDQFEVNHLITAFVNQERQLSLEYKNDLMVRNWDNPALSFLYPWDPNYDYFLWRKAQRHNDKLDESVKEEEDNIMELVAMRVIVKGRAYELELRETKCLDGRFSFLLPWDPLHPTYQERLSRGKVHHPESTPRSSSGDEEMMDKLSEIVAYHGSDLEYQLRTLLYNQMTFSFLFPWGVGYDAYLEKLCRNLILHPNSSNDSVKEYTAVPSPHEHKVKFIDHLVEIILNLTPSMRRQLFRSDHPELRFLQPGDTYHPFFRQQLTTRYSTKGKGVTSGDKFDYATAKETIKEVIDLDMIITEDFNSSDQSLLKPSSDHSLFKPSSDHPDQGVSRQLKMIELSSYLVERDPQLESILKGFSTLDFINPDHSHFNLYRDSVENHQFIIDKYLNLGKPDDPFTPEWSSQLVIDKVAELISMVGLDLYESLRSSQLLPFLHESHPYHIYFTWKLQWFTDPTQFYIPPDLPQATEDLFLIDHPSINTEQSRTVARIARFALYHGDGLVDRLAQSVPSHSPLSFIRDDGASHAYFQWKRAQLRHHHPLLLPTQVTPPAPSSQPLMGEIAHHVLVRGAACQHQLTRDHPHRLAFLTPTHPDHPHYLSQLHFTLSSTPYPPHPFRYTLLPPPSPPRPPTPPLTDLQRKRLARVRKLFPSTT